jgi:hypothetical protein
MNAHRDQNQREPREGRQHGGGETLAGESYKRPSIALDSPERVDGLLTSMPAIRAREAGGDAGVAGLS